MLSRPAKTLLKVFALLIIGAGLIWGSCKTIFRLHHVPGQCRSLQQAREFGVLRASLVPGKLVLRSDDGRVAVKIIEAWIEQSWIAEGLFDEIDTIEGNGYILQITLLDQRADSIKNIPFNKMVGQFTYGNRHIISLSRWASDSLSAGDMLDSIPTYPIYFIISSHTPKDSLPEVADTVRFAIVPEPQIKQ